MHDITLDPQLGADVAARRSSAARSEYDIAMPSDARRALAFGWLVLGLCALVAAGVLSLLLVVSRTPGLGAALPGGDFFRTILVAHVDLSVLVWFLAFAAVLWTISGGPQAIAAGRAALVLASVGALAIAFAPFVEPARPILSNYVPVLDGRVFVAGLAIFALGVGIACARGMAVYRPVGNRLDGHAALRLGLNASLVSAGIAAFAFAASFAQLDRALVPATYYELVFWGTGHALQFTYLLLMMVAWIWIASALGAELPLTPRVVALLFAIALGSVYVTPYIYLAHPVASFEHARLQTWLMRFGGTIIVPPIALAVAWGAWPPRPTSATARPLGACLFASLALFGFGGLIGFTISGSNVRVPAHYHGCIVGVTLAMMGVTYLLLPRFGFEAPSSRLARWQPWVYAAGQCAHIVGLVVSGGYGVPRKVAGAEQQLRTAPEIIGMGIMGAGGLLAIIGGLLFLVVVAQSLRRRSAAAPATGRE